MVTLTKGNPMDATACKAPTTFAAPPMSALMSSILADGFREMPPVSKVMPLPESTSWVLLKFDRSCTSY